MDRRTRARARLAKQRRRSEAGAAAVEFALVLPLLAMLLIGTVTVGLAYSNHVALTNAVREGARLGASAPANSGWAQSVIDQTTSTYADANNPLQTSDVCAGLYQSDGTLVTGLGSVTSCPDEPAAPADVPSGDCYVKVWASRPVDLNWVLGSATVTMHAQSVSLYDRQDSCTAAP